MEKIAQKFSNVVHGASTPFIRRSALLDLLSEQCGNDARPSVAKTGASLSSCWQLLIYILVVWPSHAEADRCDRPAGVLVSVEGEVNVADRPALMSALICSEEPIEVGADSRAALRLGSTQTIVRIDQNSTFRVRSSETNRSWLELLRGKIFLFSRKPESLRVDTPYVNAAIDGTEFVVTASNTLSEVTVIEGNVLVSNAFGEIHLAAGEKVSAGVGVAPQRAVVVDSLNAVQWALHYPSIGASENTSEAVRSAAQLLARGDVVRAEALLEDAPEDAASLALLAMIAVTRNRVMDASRLSERAVKRDAKSSVAYMALSYAQQARFEIEHALESVKVAVQNDPTNADALSRQAELALGVGNTAAALASAREAIAVAPDNSRARTVLGFTRLIRLEIDEAEAAFAEAISRDPGDPLPRLGLGLVTIRNGRLVEGRKHLEVAAALGPNDALVRSYLGKAYAEEREYSNASSQFVLAKQLDPQDPTPWVYDALLAQMLNRPVKAFHQINRARSLNDNRLVYQSRLLVDKDEAAGSLSLARIYSDLGFEQLAINESTRSIALDPINYSAYRLLADSYAGRERHEAARQNVQLLAALLQPLTINPVHLYEQESDLLTLPGTDPTDPSIREYSPMFEREGFQLAGSFIAGEDTTFGDNLVFSGLRNQIAYGVGHSHYKTNGATQNADIEHNVYHGFIQKQIRPAIFLQADLQRRKTDQGDFAVNFNPGSLASGRRVIQETTTPRLGIRADLNPRTTLLLAVRAIDRSESILEPQQFFNLRTSSDIEGFEGFVRYIHSGDNFQQTFGVDAHELDQRSSTTFEIEPCTPESCMGESGNAGSSYSNYYYYTDFATRRHLIWTLGLTYSTLDDKEALLDRKYINPKLGIRWQPTESHELRLLASRGVKRSTAADQRLEPPVIAGFNQVYDDFGGTRFIDTGIAYDIQLGSTNFMGVELLHRKLEVPVKSNSLVDQEDTRSFDESQRETRFRIYWNRIINRNTSLGLGIDLEHSEREGSTNGAGEQTLSLPLSVDTHKLPVRMSYTHPSGFFAQSEISYVNQKIESTSQGIEAVTADSLRISDKHFTNIDLSLGWKFTKRRMTFRLDVNNLLDEVIQFQGGNIRSAEPRSPRFSPRRTLVGKVSFSF